MANKKKRSRTSDNRRTKRLLLRRGQRGEEFQEYVDNKGIAYDYKWVAKLSSFYNLIMGCFKNGFPIVVPKLWYTAWAFYPFFFVRKDLKVADPIAVLNHERIHVRQQRDIHLVVSLPLLILCVFSELYGLFPVLPILCIIPFIPTLFYGFEMLRTWRNMMLLGTDGDEVTPITFKTVRENTCYERESIMRATNAEYLYHRKFFAVLAYTGWKRFQNYGMDK